MEEEKDEEEEQKEEEEEEEEGRNWRQKEKSRLYELGPVCKQNIYQGFKKSARRLMWEK